MEFFVGAMSMLIGMFVINKFISKSKHAKVMRVKFTQSNTNEMLRDYIPVSDMIPSFKQRKKTQSSDHFDSISTRILFLDGYAWWIKNNTLFNAELIEGNFDENSGKKVDTMTMDDVELKKTVFIVEKLTEGIRNDSGNSGK
jgi:hypothetical protein